MPKTKKYVFIEWTKFGRRGLMVPPGFVKLSGYGTYIPVWLEEELKKSNVQKLKVFFDLKEKAILLSPSKEGDFKFNPQTRYGKNMLHMKKLIEKILPEGIATPTLFPCTWIDNYKGWLIDLTKPVKEETRTDDI